MKWITSSEHLIDVLSISYAPKCKKKKFHNYVRLYTAHLNLQRYEITYVVHTEATKNYKFYIYITVTWFFTIAQQHLVGQDLLTIEAPRSHSDTSHLVGLLGASYQPDAETPTWRHTTLTRDRHPRPRQNSNPQSNGLRPTR